MIIVISIRERTKEQIDEECKIICNNKLKIMNLISEQTTKEEREYELVENNELLGNLNTYIQQLTSHLWEQPRIAATIIENADKKELKEYLAPLFANNFYENILSTNYIEDNLIYLLTLLLRDEIYQLNNINQCEKFLKSTPCGYVLEELKRRADIQSFFKTIIFNEVEKLENKYSSLKLKFKIKNLKEDYLNGKKEIEKNKSVLKKEEEYSLFLPNFDKQKMEKIIHIFNQKYANSLDKNALKEIIEENKDNKNMYDYCSMKLNDCSNKSIYTNGTFLQNLYISELSDELLHHYVIYFYIVISFIDSLLDNIINNFCLIPYSVKCICKIISLLITKKFPSVTEIEKNFYVSKFFFIKLLIPFLRNPEIESFINNFIISENTIKNLFIITLIIKKFTSGKLFKSDEETGDYTPYNWFFLEKLEKFVDICDHLTKVQLPSFIEKIINNDLSVDYEYNYFKENPEEVINHRSILFNLRQIKIILNIINKCQEQIYTSAKNYELKKIVEELMSKDSQQLLNSILNIEKKPAVETSHSKTSKKDKGIEPEKRKIQYFLFSELLTNDRYKKLFSLVQKSPYFSIEELKSIPNEKTLIQNDIIKVKNLFCCLLYNYNELIKTDFEEGRTLNTEKILKELIILMKSPNYVMDTSIPAEWYANSLIEYLSVLPKYLTNNDCEKLYSEIESDINGSIKDLDFEALSVIIRKLKYTRKRRFYYEEIKNLLNDIKINEKVKSIIQNEFIPIEFQFYMIEDDGEFQINVSNFKEKDRFNEEKIKDYEKSKKSKLCTTIAEFIKKFPYLESEDFDIFQIQTNLDIPKNINFYINLVRSFLENKHISDLDLIIQKIYDYFMSKIYDRICPVKPYEKDNKIYQNSLRLSWAKPNNFIKSKKKLILGSFVTDVLKHFKNIDEEKSPRKKILNMNEIFNSVGFLLKFNEDGADVGVDDQIPILCYAFVKAQPLRLFSNAKYMELYIGEKKNKREGIELAQLSSVCDIISSMKYTDLIGVSPEEFNKKFNEEITIEIPT